MTIARMFGSGQSLDVAGRLQELEARVTALESRPSLKYAGVWREGLAYDVGQLATHQGGLWLATAATTLRPGESDSGWRLIVKSRNA